MNRCPRWFVLIPFCAGLAVATTTSAQERDGLFVPHAGMQFTTNFTNEFGRDAESLTTVTAVTTSGVSIDYSSSRGVSVHRELLVDDRQNATSYVLGYEQNMPGVIPGTTSLGISAVVLSQLRSQGRAQLTLIYSPKLDRIDCNLALIASDVMMRLLVEDRIVEIPSLHARAECGSGSRIGGGDFFFANDLRQPLLIESTLNFNWETRPRTERITRVVDGPGLHPDMERSLKTIGRYDAYGLHFAFDSAVLRPDSMQLVAEIARMLNANASWEILIVGHTDSTGGPEYNVGLSNRRAEAVRVALVDQGVDSRRLSSQGLGETQPKADNDTLAGRAINRRVEFRRRNDDVAGTRPLDAR